MGHRHGSSPQLGKFAGDESVGVEMKTWKVVLVSLVAACFVYVWMADYTPASRAKDLCTPAHSDMRSVCK
jgi:hypothetical protein